MKKAPVLFLAFSGAAAVLSLAWVWLGERRADEAQAATVRLGRTLYAQRCASCHGVKLEGQPDWKSPLPTGKMPAPPHDASGHTWHHPDSVLFRITREGPAAIVGSGYKSDMPRFGGVLSDEEIRAVLAFIKSTWPERERAYQEEMTRRKRAQAE
ncbi:c-type cytochrome [Ensifer sp. P24N7]|uniref:c-type cytochrome n=1 Tax=Sinorhizobium sp. P24N7 TaxID=3348358 RepID=UPI0035F47903